MSQRMHRIRPLAALAALLLVTAAPAQKLQQRMADRYNDVFDYNKVIAIYEDLDARGKSDAATLRQLAVAYTKVDNAPGAEGAYRRLMIAPGRTTDDVRAFGDALRANGKYNEALEQYQAYAKERPDDARVNGYLRTPDLFYRLRRDSTSATIRKVPVNSPQADLGMSVMGEFLLFSSARGEGTGGGRSYAWDDQPFLNLYSAELKGETAENPLVMRQHINTRWHDGTLSFDSLAKRVYFTRNNVWYGTVQKSKRGELNLGIYFSDIVKGEFGQEEWGNIVPFDHNDPEFNLGHPSVSPDGRNLYFASDRPGGMGGVDIWVCKNLGNQWGAPENMGPKVNTPGDEMHPHMAANGTLYFASNGHPGLGGYDLFFTRIGTSGPGNVFNLGYPMSTRHNDHGLILINDSTGFFVSDRIGGQGSDDIYGCTIRPQQMRLAGRVIDKATKEPIETASITVKDGKGETLRNASVQMLPGGKFTIDAEYRERYLLAANATGYNQAEMALATNDDPLEEIVIEMEKYDYLAEGTVFDGNTNLPLTGATVVLTDAQGKEMARHATDASGNYSFPLLKEMDYRLQAEKENYFKQSARISTRTATSPIIRTDFRLFPLEVNQVVRLDNIFYDYNKWNIRPDAAVELDKLVQTLRDNPTVRIELSSHTDCRGKDAYNKSLSEKRAKSAVDYLISQGIEKGRLVSKGYGESKPSETCVCEKCSEEQHQNNRRTEFKVLSK
ncbi:MAG: carboxypeptidase regulatory-like domain-containing protein [Flavobacteriales bacterium]|nr:carboxypeptidase regulatory-like domain-containing protein [Flavobacteriales bacterium]